MSNKGKWSSVSWIITLLAFGISGLFMGWLVGASRSPVVATFLPLVFGLIGALSYGLIDKSKKSESFLSLLESLSVENDVKQKIIRGLDLSPATYWSRMYWALGVILFCVASFIGIQFGLGKWAPPYTTTIQMMEEAGIDSKTLEPEQYAAICNLRYRMEYLGAPQQEIQAVFRGLVKKSFGRSDGQVRLDNEELGESVEALLGKGENCLYELKIVEKKPFSIPRPSLQPRPDVR